MKCCMTISVAHACCKHLENRFFQKTFYMVVTCGLVEVHDFIVLTSRHSNFTDLGASCILFHGTYSWVNVWAFLRRCQSIPSADCKYWEDAKLGAMFSLQQQLFPWQGLFFFSAVALASSKCSGLFHIITLMACLDYWLLPLKAWGGEWGFDCFVLKNFFHSINILIK